MTVHTLPTATNLPQARDAERALLGTALLYQSTIDTASQVLPEHFYDERHQFLWSVMREAHSKGLRFDLIVMLEQMGAENVGRAGGYAYVSGHGDTAAVPDYVPTLARIICDRAERRDLILRAARVRDLALDVASPIADVRAEVDRLVGPTMDTASSSGWVSAEQAAEQLYLDLIAAREARARGEVRGLATSLPALDERLGGLHAGDLTVLAARPGMGKTALALQVAAHVAEHHGPVAFLSLEMPLLQLLRRHLARDSGVHATKLQHASWGGHEWEAISASCDRLSRLPILVSDTPTVRAQHLAQHVRRAAHEAQRRYGRPLALVVLDYLQLVTASGRSREQEVAGIARTLKATVAMGLECHVLALSQLNRECENRSDKRPRMSDLRESGSLEQDASNVVLMLRRGAYPQDFPPDRCDPSLLEVIAAKARHGEPGSVWATWDGGHQRVTQHDDQESQGGGTVGTDMGQNRALRGRGRRVGARRGQGSPGDSGAALGALAGDCGVNPCLA